MKQINRLRKINEMMKSNKTSILDKESNLLNKNTCINLITLSISSYYQNALFNNLAVIIYTQKFTFKNLFKAVLLIYY